MAVVSSKDRAPESGHRPLVVSLNEDGTVTLRCDADAFFAHADAIRHLLVGEPASEDEPAASPSDPAAVEPAHDPALTELWGEVFPADARPDRDLSPQGTRILAAAYYLTRLRGFASVTRPDLERVLGAVAAGEAAAAKPGTLVHLARQGWLERVRRGSYRLTRRGEDRVTSLRDLAPRPAARPEQGPAALPDLTGLAHYLREVPAHRKWRQVLLVAYFLRAHCGIEEVDQRLISACLRRLRGVQAPSSLPSLISQVLCRRHGLLEKTGRRGHYRLTPRALEELRKNPRVADADAAQAVRQLARSTG